MRGGSGCATQSFSGSHDGRRELVRGISVSGRVEEMKSQNEGSKVDQHGINSSGKLNLRCCCFRELECKTDAVESAGMLRPRLSRTRSREVVDLCFKKFQALVPTSEEGNHSHHLRY